jgi:hypothetical protein
MPTFTIFFLKAGDALPIFFNPYDHNPRVAQKIRYESGFLIGLEYRAFDFTSFDFAITTRKPNPWC